MVGTMVPRVEPRLTASGKVCGEAAGSMSWGSALGLRDSLARLESGAAPGARAKSTLIVESPNTHLTTS